MEQVPSIKIAWNLGRLATCYHGILIASYLHL